MLRCKSVICNRFGGATEGEGWCAYCWCPFPLNHPPNTSLHPPILKVHKIDRSLKNFSQVSWVIRKISFKFCLPKKRKNLSYFHTRYGIDYSPNSFLQPKIYPFDANFEPKLPNFSFYIFRSRNLKKLNFSCPVSPPAEKNLGPPLMSQYLINLTWPVYKQL